MIPVATITKRYGARHFVAQFENERGDTVEVEMRWSGSVRRMVGRSHKVVSEKAAA